MSSFTMVCWGPALATSAIGAFGAVLAAVIPQAASNAVSIGLFAAITSFVLATAAHVQGWTRFAWAPVIGFAVATLGNVIGNDPLAYGGAFLTMVLVVAHGMQEQRRKAAVAHS